MTFVLRSDKTFSMLALEMLVLIMPILIGGVLHMLVVRYNLLKFLNRPIGKIIFGINKTYRGFVIMPLGTQIGFYITKYFLPEISQRFFSNFQLHWLGWLLGLAYVLFELPNSFIKRRLGIPPGQVPNHHRIIFLLSDRLDSIFGVMLVYKFVCDIPIEILLSTSFFGLGIHLMVTNLLFQIGIRKQKY